MAILGQAWGTGEGGEGGSVGRGGAGHLAVAGGEGGKGTYIATCEEELQLELYICLAL